MRIIVADDHALFRESLRALLKSRGFEVVGEAADGAEAITLSWELKPDVVLMDLAMPGMDGLEATKRLAAELPDIKIVILTGSEEDEDLFEAIKSGAKGYLIKDLETEQFLELLGGISRGEPALTPALAKRLLSEFAKPRTSREQHDLNALTARESEVLEKMVMGTTSNRALAKALDVSENTVKFHVRNILDKLYLHNRAQVVGYALRHNLIDPPAGSE